MKTTKDSYWHYIEEMFEFFLEEREKLIEQEEDNIEDQLKTYLYDLVFGDDWVNTLDNCVKVFSYTNNIETGDETNTDKMDYGAFRAMATDCIVMDVLDMVSETDEIEYEVDFGRDEDLEDIDFDL